MLVFNYSSKNNSIDPTLRAPTKTTEKKPLVHSPKRETLSFYYKTSLCLFT